MVVDNPYLAVYEAHEQSDGFINGKYIPRNAICAKYAWAVPNDEALLAIKNFSYNRIVEVGAGNGYWAHLLDQLDVRITAYDIEPYKNRWMDGTQWHPVFRRGGLESVIAEQAQQYHWEPFTLMMVWPYMNEMAYDSLMAYEGNQLIYVGEGHGGCTANDDFFDALYDLWTPVKTIHIPQWSGIHDYLELYERA